MKSKKYDRQHNPEPRQEQNCSSADHASNPGDGQNEVSQMQSGADKEPPPQNPTRNWQIIASLLLVCLSTLSVQITMQRYAPFIRATQCYFNRKILQHDSEDIYEGRTVIYYRTGESWLREDIVSIYENTLDAISTLEEDTLFRLRNVSLEEGYDVASAVQMMAVYTRGDTHRFYRQSLVGLPFLFQSTIFARSFYHRLKQLQLLVTIPILYRAEAAFLVLKVSTEFHSGLQALFKISTDIVDSHEQQVRSGQGLGIRKLTYFHDMAIQMKYIGWINVALYLTLFLMEYRYILQRNRQVNRQLRRQAKEEARLEMLIESFSADKDSAPPSPISSEGHENAPLSSTSIRISLSKRCDLIGRYYLLQLATSLVAIVSCYNEHNGLVCFLSWTKLVLYLSETRNTLMLGRLFKEAIPIYLRLLLNILIIMSGFVFFNMLMYRTTRKFETVELSYFEFFFNYFQYGIYENFFALNRFGSAAHALYLLNLLVLLYVGNNILQSILANEVLKFSYLDSLNEMLETIDGDCPACGQSPKAKPQISLQLSQQNGKFLSRFLQEHQLEMGDNRKLQKQQYDIIVLSPKLSPFFPQQAKQAQSMFYSPRLRGGQLQKKVKQINDKMANNEQTGQARDSEVQEIKLLNEKYNPKVPKFQIGDSRISTDNLVQGLHAKMKINIESLHKAINAIKEVQKRSRKESQAVLRQIAIVQRSTLVTCHGKIANFQQSLKGRT